MSNYDIINGMFLSGPGSNPLFVSQKFFNSLASELVSNCRVEMRGRLKCLRITMPWGELMIKPNEDLNLPSWADSEYLKKSFSRLSQNLDEIKDIFGVA